MSAFVLKIIVVVSMVVDHLAVVLLRQKFSQLEYVPIYEGLRPLGVSPVLFSAGEWLRENLQQKKVPLKACDVCGLVPDPLCHGILGYELRGDIRHNGTEL